MKRMASAVILTGAAWMGLPGAAQAQVLIMPTGPLSLRAPARESLQGLARLDLYRDNFSPVARWAGGPGFSGPIPPPSSLKRRKE